MWCVAAVGGLLLFVPPPAPRRFLSGKVGPGHPGAFCVQVSSLVASYTLETSRFPRQMHIRLQPGPALGRLADVSSHETGFKRLGVVSGRPTKSFFCFSFENMCFICNWRICLLKETLLASGCCVSLQETEGMERPLAADVSTYNMRSTKAAAGVKTARQKSLRRFNLMTLGCY